MGRSIRGLINALPEDRKAKVRAQARAMADEMIAASSMESLRQAANQTQTEVAQKLGIGQGAISQLEKRTDVYLSTLARYVKALGLQLELTVKTTNGDRVPLPNFRPWESVAASARGAVTKASAKQVVKAKGKGAGLRSLSKE